jgi:hypothetical protein
MTAASKSKNQIHRKIMSDLATYLDVHQDWDNKLSELEDNRLHGSCEWLTDRDSFQEWQFVDESPRYFWLKGKPATGKSVLASHVINNLEGTRCSFYFFKHDDQEKSTLSGFLRSMAYQMAGTSRPIRDKLLEIAQEDPFLDRDNHRSIWHKLFTGGIFHTTFHHM